MKTDWDKRFMDLAEHVSKWSKDRRKKVGSVIVDDDRRVISMGFNGFASKINDDVEERHVKPLKNFYVEHAERNSIYSAAKSGIALKGTTIYINWFACSECCRAIIQSGIKRVVCIKPDFEDDSWGEAFKVSKSMFEEAGVEVAYLD